MESRRQVFTAEILERYATRGRGAITCMAAGNDVILLGTSKGWIIRYDFGIGDFYEIDLCTSRTGEQGVRRVFVDPGGSHCIATVLGNGGADTFYTHAKWSKPRLLSKLKGLSVNSVAWNRQQITEVTTRETIIGTENGQLHEMAVDEKDKREKYLKLLFELKELPEAFMGLQMETANVRNGTRYYVMVVTPTRLYSFTGIGSLETVFSSYLDREARFMELPGEIPNSELHFYIKQRRAVHFSWLSGAGIYHGGLNFGAQHSSADGDENFVENKSLLSYSKLGIRAEQCSSLAVSEFHFLLLVRNTVMVVNRVSERIVEEVWFERTTDPVSTEGILGLCSDASAGLFYAYDQNSIYQITANDESREMWKVYLNMKEYAAALAHCQDLLQRDEVYLVQAEAAFSSKDFPRSASFYAKVHHMMSFEEVALKFINVGEQDALRIFLLRKLDSLSKADKCQVTMISTWAAELYLDKINRLVLEDNAAAVKDGSGEYQLLLDEFCAFLSDCRDALDEATTMKLLESYGRGDELVYFAGLKERYDIVVSHYIQRGDGKKALEMLRKPTIPLDLVYNYSPDLMMLEPRRTVELWMATKNLNPRNLIPAMMRGSDSMNEVIKYLEFCVHRLSSDDPGIHNLLVSLYAKQDDGADDALLRFLQHDFGRGRRGDSPEFFYDPKYALRLCLKEGKTRACVHIYSMMSMHEEAVSLALRVDVDLAMAEADKAAEAEDDDGTRKKLWLMVARHVVEQEKGTKRDNIRRATAFLKETDGLLKIEDILPFFPDFALIDDFREAICSSLDDYNRQIHRLKREMADATRAADTIRSDIIALAQRYTVIRREEPCGVCRTKILASLAATAATPPFYVFPCGHAFHSRCLIAHVTRCSDPHHAGRILDLQKSLALADPDLPHGDDAPPASQLDETRQLLDEAIAGECPFCGDLVIREIALPFILTGPDADSWGIKPFRALAHVGTFSPQSP